MTWGTPTLDKPPLTLPGRKPPVKNLFKLPLAALIALTCVLGAVGPAHAGTTPLGATQILETPDSRTS